MPFNFRRYEFWRAHPALQGKISSLLPGFLYGAALTAGYIALDQAYGPMIPHKYHADDKVYSHGNYGPKPGAVVAHHHDEHH